MFLEPEGAVARYENGRMTVYACLQYAHLARDEVAKALALPRSQVRVIFPAVGGGFGGKEDNGLLCHAAMLAKYTNRTVKMVHSRIESTVVGTKRHPFFIKAKTGATKDGHVLARDVYMLADTGAYADAGPVVATRAIMHFMGPYNIPNIRGECVLVYTNNPISGAFRGFGAPQATICYEGQMNALARRLKMDPLELRILNAHRVGSVTATGQVLKESVGFIETIKKAREKADAVMGKTEQSLIKENE